MKYYLTNKILKGESSKIRSTGLLPPYSDIIFLYDDTYLLGFEYTEEWYTYFFKKIDKEIKI
jgi:hypothetical protein